MDPELKSLIDSLTKNPDSIKDLPHDEVIRLHKLMNPYAPSGADTKEYINISISNQRDEYLRKFLMTSMVGYLFRTLDEWDPYEDCEKERDEQCAKIIKEQVARFLSRNLKYNPDRHVASTHSANAGDPERSTKEAMLETRMNRPSPPNSPTTSTIADAAKQTWQTLMETTRTLSTCIAVADDENKGILVKHKAKCDDLIHTLNTYVVPLCEQDTHDVYLVDPPTDVYYHLDRYISNNYEQLREATAVLFNDKPDLEFAIHYYGHYETKDAADEFKRRNEARFINPVFTIENGAWTLLGPFKENRDRIEFYNKNTEILRRIFEQMEADQKLGKDLMKKKVMRQKKKEYVDTGLDPKGLEEYKAAVGTIESLGAKPILTREEKEKLADAVKVKEMGEVPENAIQVDVFHKTHEGKLAKGKFYTQSEDPKFMSEQIEEMRNRLLGTGKRVHDRHGNVINIEDRKKIPLTQSSNNNQ